MAHRLPCKFGEPITIPRGAPGDSFGSSAALSANGKILLVGSAEDAQVFVYKYDCKWLKTQVLSNAISTFGERIVLSPCGTYAFVSGQGANGEAGQVVVFVMQNGYYQQQALLTPSDSQINDAFGFTMASADAQHLIVGAPTNSSHPDNTGKVYVFARQGSNWVEKEIIVGDAGSYFGISVGATMGACTLAIGGFAVNTASGAVFIYKSTSQGYELVQTLEPSSLIPQDFFGYQLWLTPKGGELAILKPAFGGGDPETFLYKRQDCTYTQIRTFTNPASSLIENSVVLARSSSVLLIGAPTANIGGTPFEIYFSCDGVTWLKQQTIAALLPYPNDGSAFALSADGNTLVAVRAEDGYPVVVYRRGTK